MSNQDYTQGNQDAQGMDQDSYGSMREPDPMEPRLMNPNQMDPNQMGQVSMGVTGDTGDRGYGMSDQNTQSGTLDQGYGQGEQMGEDQWAQQGGGGDTGEEFRDMVGGMYGEDDDSQSDQ